MPAHILVVEDNRTNRELMTYLLRAFGYEVTAVAEGETGLREAQSGSYDLILCDVLMPGIDGFEFSRRYQGLASDHKPPLVAVSALAMVGDRERLLRAGFNGYISKPIDPEKFVSQIEQFLPEGSRSKVAPVAAPSQTPAEARSHGPVVLAVDDTPVNLDVIRSALQPFGYRLVTASNAKEGLQLALSSDPALILCDLHMPGGDGFQLLHAVKISPALQGIPFLFLSSTAWNPIDQIRGLQLGAKKFLLRPIEPSVLRAEIESALGG